MSNVLNTSNLFGSELVTTKVLSTNTFFTTLPTPTNKLFNLSNQFTKSTASLSDHLITTSTNNGLIEPTKVINSINTSNLNNKSKRIGLAWAKEKAKQKGSSVLKFPFKPIGAGRIRDKEHKHGIKLDTKDKGNDIVKEPINPSNQSIFFNSSQTKLKGSPSEDKILKNSTQLKKNLTDSTKLEDNVKSSINNKFSITSTSEITPLPSSSLIKLNQTHLKPEFKTKEEDKNKDKNENVESHTFFGKIKKLPNILLNGLHKASNKVDWNSDRLNNEEAKKSKTKIHKSINKVNGTTTKQFQKNKFNKSKSEVDKEKSETNSTEEEHSMPPELLYGIIGGVSGLVIIIIIIIVVVCIQRRKKKKQTQLESINETSNLLPSRQGSEDEEVVLSPVNQINRFWPNLEFSPPSQGSTALDEEERVDRNSTSKESIIITNEEIVLNKFSKNKKEENINSNLSLYERRKNKRNSNHSAGASTLTANSKEIRDDNESDKTIEIKYDNIYDEVNVDVHIEMNPNVTKNIKPIKANLQIQRIDSVDVPLRSPTLPDELKDQNGIIKKSLINKKVEDKLKQLPRDEAYLKSKFNTDINTKAKNKFKNVQPKLYPPENKTSSKPDLYPPENKDLLPSLYPPIQAESKNPALIDHGIVEEPIMPSQALSSIAESIPRSESPISFISADESKNNLTTTKKSNSSKGGVGKYKFPSSFQTNEITEVSAINGGKTMVTNMITKNDKGLINRQEPISSQNKLQNETKVDKVEAHLLHSKLSSKIKPVENELNSNLLPPPPIISQDCSTPLLPESASIPRSKSPILSDSQGIDLGLGLNPISNGNTSSDNTETPLKNRRNRVGILNPKKKDLQALMKGEGV